MLLLGHMGITLGTAALLDGAFSRSSSLSSQSTQRTEQTRQTKPSLLSKIDLRLLLIGALLPDIIDKPLGQVFLRDTLSNGRIFCHTLLFLILITLAGFYLYRRRKKTWLLIVSFGTLMHLILDQMWLEPRTLVWPLRGLSFEKTDLTHYVQDTIHGLHTSPAVYVPEIVGAGILICFVWMMVQRRTMFAFIRNGKVVWL